MLDLKLSLTALLESKTQLRFVIISCLFFIAACTTLIPTEKVYSSKVQELPDGLFYIKVESRLEYEAQSVMLREANKTCNSQQKQRMLILKKEINYVDQDTSEYDTGFYKLEVEIKCK